ncbi:hypothetical protein FJTKL_02631 [Diaporthe vaccinii]|uniref:J domain-containing protein n=1 Tax=Diaporthe vaccinii TaxID=105482 RepID=A0ABR4DXH8_9PEZI
MLPGPGCRPSAGGFSSRLSCRILNGRGPNAVPWATCQQMRFASGDEDNYKDDYYATLGVKPSDSIETIRKAGNALRMATHSDHNKGIDNDKFIKANAAVRVLGNQEKKAKYDKLWWARQHAAQANAATQQREADELRRAAFARELARRREEAKRAMEAAEAAEAKKRDEERKARRLAKRKARRLAKREAQRAEAERQKKAAEEAARKKKEEEEAATRKKAQAAAAREAAVQARAAERERERVREARMVVLRHVPIRASLFTVTQALESFRPGRILDSGVGEGTAWFEFWTAEQAQALRHVVTETDQCVILGKTIKSASIYQGRVKPPEGPELITRSLCIIATPDFLDGEAKLYPVLKRPTRGRGGF